MKTNILLLLFLSIFGLRVSIAQQSEEKFVFEINYLLYLPESYNDAPKKNWPLLVFLHGAGERGNDLEKVKKHGPPMLIEQGKKLPFIVASPQSKGRWNSDFLMQMIQNIINNQRVDKDRIYLTGLSMGGYGTWKLALKHPGFFAAIAPICGGGDPSEIWKLRHLPVWCFHGDADHIVPIAQSEAMINPLKKINSQAKFTTYPKTGHDSWVKAYNNPQLYKWLLSHKKYKHKAIDINKSELNQLEGSFLMQINERTDTAIVKVINNQLTIITDNKSKVLKPLAKDAFFLKEDIPFDLKFIRDSEGNVEAINIYADRLIVLPKIQD